MFGFPLCEAAHELLVRMGGQHDAQFHEVIALAMGRRHSLAAQTQNAARIRPLRHAQLYGSRHRRGLHRRPGQGFTGSDRQNGSNVVAVPAEDWMRRDMDLHERVPRFTTLQPGWDGNIERLAVGHGHPFLGTIYRLGELYGHRVADIGTSGSHPGAALTEDLREEVVLIVRPAFLPAALVLEARASLGMLAVELALRLLALGAGCIYLAAVETRALLLVAEDIIGRGDVLEACFRAFIARMQIRVAILGEPAVGLADFLLRRLAANTQHFVRVCHGRVLGELPAE